MTLEIADRAAFKEKFNSLLVGTEHLFQAGIEPTDELASKLIDSFLDQFVSTQPVREEPSFAGYLVVTEDGGIIPGDFKDTLFPTVDDAEEGINALVSKRPYINADAYKVVEATYFG